LKILLSETEVDFGARTVDILEAITVGSTACTGFTITYYGTLDSKAATGLETISAFFCTAKVFSDFCYKTFS
jgi:hypothetical protein